MVCFNEIGEAFFLEPINQPHGINIPQADNVIEPTDGLTNRPSCRAARTFLNNAPKKKIEPEQNDGELRHETSAGEVSADSRHKAPSQLEPDAPLFPLYFPFCLDHYDDIHRWP